jgi:hypothetical protein
MSIPPPSQPTGVTVEQDFIDAERVEPLSATTGKLLIKLRACL